MADEQSKTNKIGEKQFAIGPRALYPVLSPGQSSGTINEQENSEYIQIKVIEIKNENQVQIRFKPGHMMRKLKIAELIGRLVTELQFLFNGQHVKDDNTIRSLNMKNEDIIVVRIVGDELETMPDQQKSDQLSTTSTTEADKLAEVFKQKEKESPGFVKKIITSPILAQPAPTLKICAAIAEQKTNIQQSEEEKSNELKRNKDLQRMKELRMLKKPDEITAIKSKITPSSQLFSKPIFGQSMFTKSNAGFSALSISVPTPMAGPSGQQNTKKPNNAADVQLSPSKIPKLLLTKVPNAPVDEKQYTVREKIEPVSPSESAIKETVAIEQNKDLLDFFPDLFTGKEPIVNELGPLDSKKRIYEAEEILAKRSKKGKTEYKVKWLNWSKRKATWEPEENLQVCGVLGDNDGAPDLMRVFEDGQNAKAPRLRRSTRLIRGDTPSTSKMAEDEEPSISSASEKDIAPPKTPPPR